MDKINRKASQTPSEFYRKRRPEFFSDTKRVYKVKLPREHFAYELSKISANQKQDAFETLGRRLAEKFISPNLIPQVGPTGGGDGKTDSETYPVSESLAERWFVPENGWKRDENWAFAISAKQDWKSKIRKDVEKIVSTNRGYSKVFFISNQLISSRKKKESQDELKIKFNIDVIILDGEWIIEKIYNNDLINLAVDTLNLSDVYKDEEVRVGQHDVARIKKLEEIEEKISNTNRYFEYDYQLVEDALEAAIITRMLERPKDEVIGKFDRVLRLGQKVKNTQQLNRIHYQRSWTYIYWYDDYSNFFNEFKLFKSYAKQDPNLNSIELYFNLINILRGITLNEEIAKAIPNFNYENEESEYREVLETCISNTNKPTTSLIANTYKSLLNIFRLFPNNGDVSEELKNLSKYLYHSRKHLEYPFESFKKIIEFLGEIMPDNYAYDELINSVAEISEERASEFSSGETFMKRGFQKLSNEYYKESLIYFGKSVRKLAKEESQYYFYIVLMGLSQAYKQLGLFWASNNCLIAASSITIKEWYNEGKFDKRFYKCVTEALKNELFIGRIPYLLSWYELFKVVSPLFEDEKSIEEDQIPISELVDACLSVRLLNSPFNTWKDFSQLPDILGKEELWLSQDAVLYMLGYTELVQKSQLDKLPNSKLIDEYYNKLANQPFKDQMVFDTNLLDDEVIEFKSVILGTEFIVKFNNDKELAFFAEMLLAYFESFLSTSFEEVFPHAESIIIVLKDSREIPSHQFMENSDDNQFEILLNLIDGSKIGSDNNYQFLLELSATILSRKFVLRDAKEYLEKLFKQDEVHERLSLIVDHRKFFTSIMGENPKILLSDWIKDVSIDNYEFKRDNNPIQIEDIIKERTGDIYEEHKNRKHNQTRVSSIIDPLLWDNARWKGFGFFIAPGIPLGVFLAYENGDFGRKIFEDWIKRFGRVDLKEEINISIIKGVDKENPFWYRVHVSKFSEVKELKENYLMVTASRFHEMNPVNPTNLNNLINGFNYLKQYMLFPALLKPDGSIEPYTDLGILKKRLTIRDAWEIGIHDLDRPVIKKDDNPIIPLDKPEAPIINLLDLKNK